MDAIGKNTRYALRASLSQLEGEGKDEEINGAGDSPVVRQIEVGVAMKKS